MKIVFGMPELLVCSGVFMISNSLSWPLSIAFITMGILGRVFDYASTLGEEKTAAKQVL